MVFLVRGESVAEEGDEKGHCNRRVQKRVPEGIPGKKDFRIAAFGRCSFLPHHNHVASSAGTPTAPHPCTASFFLSFLAFRSIFPFSVSALLITQPALPLSFRANRFGVSLSLSYAEALWRSEREQQQQQQHQNAARDKDWIGR